MVFHLRTTSKLKNPFLPVYIGFMSIIQPDVFMRNCTSPSLKTNLILSMKTVLMPEATSGSALSSVCQQIQTGGRWRIMDAKTLDHGEPICSHQINIGRNITHRVHSSTQRTQLSTTVIFLEPGQHLSSTNQMTSRKLVWSI